MKKIVVLFILLILMTGTLAAQEVVAVPWEEIKQLHRESIEREIQKKEIEEESKKQPFVYSLNEAIYRLRLAEDNAQGEAHISGTVVSGTPRPIPLFGQEMIVSRTTGTSGGILMSGEIETEEILFLPEEGAGEFQITISFLTPIRWEGGERVISFDIPTALRNVVNLELPPGARLTETPGIMASDGAYNFSPAQSLTVRFLGRDALAVAQRVEIDMLSRIRFQGPRLHVTTTCDLSRQLSQPLILQAPEGSRYIASSLDDSAIRKRENSTFEVTVPSDSKGAFWMQFAIERPQENGDYSLLLPRIDANHGSEGNFLIEQPLDGQIVLTSPEGSSQIPVSRLGERMEEAIGTDGFYTHVSPQTSVSLQVARFATVETPSIVLESVSFFTSFDENGNNLSILVMDIPSEAGPRLRLPSISDATVWSLTVNGLRRTVFVDGQDMWIVPLADGGISHVELALLRKGQPLGLHGRLETIIPETGLPSQKVFVVIGLPKRVQLLSIEGAVSPSLEKSLETPSEFIGKPHFFSRSFHKGELMKIAVSYKEPVKHF